MLGCSLNPDYRVYPLCLSWPMGFSWSSYVAQSILLQCCMKGGLGTSQILADDVPVPRDGSLTYALAADDVMVFNVARADAVRPSKQILDRLDQAITHWGVQPAPAKDENGVHDVTCIGIDVCDGTCSAPNAHKLALTLAAVVHLAVTDARVSPHGISKLNGTNTWFAQLNRPSFLVFDKIYGFVEGFSKDLVPLPVEVLRELVCFSCLIPLLEKRYQSGLDPPAYCHGCFSQLWLRRLGRRRSRRARPRCRQVRGSLAGM